MSKKKLFLLDGSYLAYRSYFAFVSRPLFTSKGENTSAVFGFTNSLVSILDQQAPDLLAVVFDTPEPTFRHRTYPEYKATREKMPEDMADQLPRIRSVIEGFNIPIIEEDGYEADDVMATLARQAVKQGYEAVLVSGDKDMLQLVSHDITMLKPGRTSGEMESVDPDWIREKWGVDPPQVRDVLSLMGDSSDNIPGIPGIGKKTAVKLVNQFGSLDKLFTAQDSLDSARIREAIKQHGEQARVAYELVTIDTNVPVKTNLNDLARRDPDAEALAEIFRELEFRVMTERFQKTKQSIRQDYRTITDLEQFDNFMKVLRKQNKFVFDIETTDQDPLRAEIVGFSVSWKEGDAFYVPIVGSELSEPREEIMSFDFTTSGQPDSSPRGLPLKNVLPHLKEVLEDPAIGKSGQNIKYDMLVLSRYEVEIKGISFDTMVASYLLDPSNRQHNIDSLALEHFNYKKIPTSDLIGSGKKQISMRDVPLEKISFYACEDADLTLRLQNLFEPRLKSAELFELFQNVEMPLISVLKWVEQNGVALDEPFLKDLSNRMEEDLIKLEEKIYHEAGQPFNINSPSQLGVILFEKLQLPSARKTKTGYSTDVAVLEKLAKIHPLPQLVLDYRQLVKLKSTYIDALPRLVNPFTRRLHTSYNQTVAATGRLSSTEPNLQNIPIRTELGRQIRKAFIPADSNHVILDADYSQIELRVMAHLSGDQGLLEFFDKNLDIHAATAAKIFEIPLDQVNQDHRRKAKEINFGIMYGMGRFGLSSRLDISFEQAGDFIDHYFAQFPGVKKFIDETIEKARKKGFVTTMMNRRRFLPEIHSNNRQIRQFAERTAINTPIQGTAADLIKVAMINIYEEFKKEKLDSMMIMQVHDELVFEVVENELDTVEKIVVRCMECALELNVPIKAEIGTGKTWLEAHR